MRRHDAQMEETNAPRVPMVAMRQPTPALENMARDSSRQSSNQ